MSVIQSLILLVAVTNVTREALSCSPATAPQPNGRTGLRTRTQHTATHLDEVTREVTVIDPGHPLCGRTFPVVHSQSHCKKSNLILLLPDGHRRSVPRSATDFDQPPHPSSQPRFLPRISVRTILPLAQQVRSLLCALEEINHDTSTDSAAWPGCTAAAIPAEATTDTGAFPVESVRSNSAAAAGSTLGRTGPASPVTTRPERGQHP